jgi:WXG100 family type VII secretion target
VVRYRVDLPALGAMIDALGSVQQGIADELERLDIRVGQLEGEWSGEAREAYATAHAAWTVQLAQMNVALGRAVGAAQTAHANYAESRRQIDAHWGVA